MKDKYLDFPIRKTFIEEFINEKGKIIFSIKYEQATMGEYFEFLAQTIEQQELEVYNLIHKNISLTIFERFLSFFSPTYRGKLERKLDLGKIVQKILSNKFRIHNSIFNNKKKKGTKKYYEAINPIMSASFANICEKYSMSPLELLNNYTLEQYSWLNDGLIFVGNLYTEEGKKENYNAVVDKATIKNNLKEIKEIFDKYGL